MPHYGLVEDMEVTKATHGKASNAHEKRARRSNPVVWRSASVTVVAMLVPYILGITEIHDCAGCLLAGS
jgi:hypothetical protein